MNLAKWEKEAYDYLIKLYDKFFEELSNKCKECYRIDIKELFSDNVKELTKEQEEKIYNYWKKYTNDFNIGYHKYYIDRTGKFDVRFIPDDLLVGYIDGYLNNRAIEPGVADKNYFDLYLKGFPLPKAYVHLINGVFEDDNYNIITKEKAAEILSNKESIIVKPSMASYGGKGIKFINNQSQEEVLEFLNNLDGDNYIFQQTVNQSAETAKLHSESLNTIRVMTLILDNNVKVLPWCTFRMGVGKSKVDNASFGGIYCRINDDGTLSEFAYNALGKKFDSHPTGGSFKNVKFDFMNDVKRLVKDAAQRFPHFRLIGWDIAIDENNKPLIIEANLTMSGMDVIETIGGPLFGEYTEQVLEEVFLKKHKKKPAIDIIQYV